MAKSQRTKDLAKKHRIFGLISYGLWLGTALFLAIFAFATLGGKESTGEVLGFLTDDAKRIVLGLGTTIIIGVVGTIIIKDKIRTAIYMASLILATILFNRGGMFVVLGIWLIDEYVINALFKHYGKLLQINKEIDLRDE